MAQNVGARSTCPTGSLHDRRVDAGGRGRPPHEGQPHQRVGVVRALVEEAEVALHLAVVGGEDDVGVGQPAPLRDRLQHAAAGLVDQLVHHVHLGVDLADLVVGQPRRDERRRAALHVGEAAVPVGEPVRGLAGQDGADGVVGAGVAGRQVEVLPRHAVELGGRRVPRVVRVGERHPAEPRLVGAERTAASRR